MKRCHGQPMVTVQISPRGKTLWCPVCRFRMLIPLDKPMQNLHNQIEQPL